jgi:hypothetical protein
MMVAAAQPSAAVNQPRRYVWGAHGTRLVNDIHEEHLGRFQPFNFVAKLARAQARHIGELLLDLKETRVVVDWIDSALATL